MAETQETRAFDALTLIRQVREGDKEALARAYALTFGNELGRLVLVSFLADCGVANALGRAETNDGLRYQIGRHDAALELAANAGYDQASIAAAVLSDELEGSTHDGREHAADGSRYIGSGGEWEF